MSAKLIFRGARIRHAHISKAEGGVFTRMYMVADYTDLVREAMGWGDGPGTPVEKATLEGALAATHIQLTPDSAPLRQHELDLDVAEVTNFTYSRVKNKSGSVSFELEFQIRTSVVGAEAVVGNYLRCVGEASQLRVNYEVQEELPLEGSDDPEQLCIECENGHPLIEGDPSLHVSGQPCAKYAGHDDGSAPLAQASMMKPRPTAEDKQRRRRLINERAPGPVAV